MRRHRAHSQRLVAPDTVHSPELRQTAVRDEPKRVQRLRVRHFAGLAIAALTSLAMASSAYAEAPACNSGHTLAASAQVRVLAFDEDPADSFPLRDGYRAYACDLKTRRVRPVGTFEKSLTSANGAYLPTANGRFVAFDLVQCGRDGCQGGGIRVLDVRTGRRRAGGQTPDGASPVTDLALSAAGSVAWVRPVGDGVLEVRALGRHGERLLDAGPDVEPGSLALSRASVYWTRGGAPHSAPLP
jgi:hypothetical protein